MSKAGQFIRIGKIAGAHGLHGRLKVFIVTDIKDRFNADNTVFMKCGPEYRKCIIVEYIDYKKKLCLIKLNGITERDDVLSLKGKDIYIERSEAERTREFFNSEEYYYYDLLGCTIYYGNEEFGVVVDILEAGAGEILLIEDMQGKKVMVPFVKSMVNTSEISKNRLYIDPVEGLIE